MGDDGCGSRLATAPQHFKTMNKGLLQEIRKPQDWIAGGYTPLGGGGINPGGQWDHYLPVIEYQNKGFDKMACVTYSLLNTLEVLHLFKTGKERNFSDRFLATTSGTTRQGNYLSTVFDKARKFGLVDESVYPDVHTTWEDYYKEIPNKIKEQALEFLNEWDLYREWIFPYQRDEILKGLDQTPLQVTVSYASGSGILYPQGVYNHAVMLYGYEPNSHWKIFDHYEGAIKRYDWDYEFGTILKPTLSNKYIPMKFKQDYLYLLVEGKEQKLGMFLDGKMVIYDNKIDTLLNSSARLKRFEPAIPVTLRDWESVPRVNGKGEII